MFQNDMFPKHNLPFIKYIALYIICFYLVHIRSFFWPPCFSVVVINAFVETSVIWGRSQLTTCVLYNRLLMDFCDFPDSSVQFRSRSPVGFLSPAWFSIFVAFAFLVRARLPVTWLAGLHCTMLDNFTTVHTLRVRDIKNVGHPDVDH